uniref:Uncharacterized protein n=1 Tax=Arundo donax TaxID=35708 RepID=A0A0A9E1Q6_ARUDO
MIRLYFNAFYQAIKISRVPVCHFLPKAGECFVVKEIAYSFGHLMEVLF